LQIEPTDLAALTDAIVRVLTEPHLRAQMIERGMRQAQRFSWAQAGQATMTLYRTVLSETKLEFGKY